MDPAIWSALPEELVEVIFAHLPAINILRLLVLSKEWRRKLTMRESKFMQLCSQYQSKIIGFVCGRNMSPRTLSVRFYDGRSQQWHRGRGLTGGEGPFETMGASDGGLVCTIERKLMSDGTAPVRIVVRIVVCNPLTSLRSLRSIHWGHHHALPYGGMTSQLPSMLQLRMDPDSQTYKLLLVGPSRLDVKGAAAAEVYESATDAWRSTDESMASTDLVFGHYYAWEDDGEEDDGEEDDDVNDPLFFLSVTGPPCAFDPAGGQLILLSLDCYDPLEINIAACRLVKDRLFILYARVYTENSRGPIYMIIEYQVGLKASRPHWKKLRTYNPPLSDMFRKSLDRYQVKLYATQNTLLVIAQVEEIDSSQELCSNCEGFAMYCDLSESVEELWHSIPAMPENLGTYSGTMCDLRWDALP
ncbi:hypothetical protein KC19_4G054300 [Ceratodon purpureus]|uniref:F-box domain-containing protein n=1 Tax=Ceratodon purpureus TaxID=3225 RepID=A0A8T0I7B5_CERPU|nr:hypothetical protein KC19_4G054300 [Ceratodon purpureus]